MLRSDVRYLELAEPVNCQNVDETFDEMLMKLQFEV